MKKFLKLIDKKNIKEIRQLVKDFTYVDLAEKIEELSTDQAVIFFRLLETDVASDLFSYLDDDLKTRLVHAFTEQDTEDIIGDLYANDIAELIEEAPSSNLVSKILKNIPKEKRNKVNKILNYTEDQIGSVMSVDIVTLEANLTTQQALLKIRKHKNKVELNHYFYVVDKNQKYLGAITLDDIVFAPINAPIESLYFKVSFLYPSFDNEKAAAIFSEEDRSALPVITKKNDVIGMVTSDDIIEILEEEASEDIYKGAGIDGDLAKEEYLKTSIKKIVKSRIFWLMILMFGATLSQVVITIFTNYIADNKNLFTALVSSAIVSLIPVISGSAGNAGSQSSTTVTRALALKEINSGNYWQVFRRELSVGIIIGSLLMIANFIRLLIYFAITKDLFGDEKVTFYVISAGASVALFIVIIFSKILGGMIPVVAAKFKKDPAVLSSPVLTTITDALSTLIFFGIIIAVILLLKSF